MMQVHMVDQAPSCEARQDSGNDAKRAKARAYLDSRGISLRIDSGFRYSKAEVGNVVLAKPRPRKAKR